MNAYLTLIRIDIRLAFRQKIVIIFNYLMPLAFFLIFARVVRDDSGGGILRVVAMVTVVGILGNGLFGAGIRAAQDRENNILRRYRVAPISPHPLLVASTVTGLVIYIPYVVLMVGLAQWQYGMPLPRHPIDMLIFVAIGVLAIRSIGLMVASVANSMQESSIAVQAIYLSMLFLSGASFPVAMFPGWLRRTAQFIPATWLMKGLEGLMLRNETLAANWQAVGALLITAGLGFFLAVKLFRWEKEEKVRPSAKLWLLAVIAPFVLLGAWQPEAGPRSLLIRDARIFTGDGNVIERGGILVTGSRIAAVYDGNIPDAASLNADAIEAAGKTVLPGLIDINVTLRDAHDLADYLYSGVTAVSTGNFIQRGKSPGAELFLVKVPNTVASLSAAEAAGNAERDRFARLNNAQDKLLRAWRAGERLIVGANIPIQHELELWVLTGIPAQDVLRAATLNAARALHVERRIGSIEKGKDATLIAIDGDPLENIKTMEAISWVMFQGKAVTKQ